jgi:2Fe-2S ferredoxin
MIPFSLRRLLSTKSVRIRFVERDGTEHFVASQLGNSLLQVSQDADLDVEGACEGTLACCTCHMILEQELYDKISKPSEEEMDMLDLAIGLTSTSRLGCQVIVNQDMEGVTIRLPPD